MPRHVPNEEDKRDQRYLLALAALIQRLIRARDHTGVTLRPQATLRCTRTRTDGYCVSVGSLSGGRGGTLQVWLDRFTGPGSRRVEYCFSATSIDRVREIERAGSEDDPALTLRNRDIISLEDSALQMSPTLPSEQVGLPILELYSHPVESFYGIYDSVPKPALPPSPALAGRAAGFFVRVARAVHTRDQADSDSRTGRGPRVPAEAQRAAVAVVAARHQGFKSSPAIRRALEEYGMRKGLEHLRKKFPHYRIHDVHGGSRHLARRAPRSERPPSAVQARTPA